MKSQYQIGEPEIPHSCGGLCLPPYSVNHFFCSSLYLSSFWVSMLLGPVALVPTSINRYLFLILQQWIEQIRFNRCYVLDLALKLIFCLLSISIWPYGCCLTDSVLPNVKHAFVLNFLHFRSRIPELLLQNTVHDYLDLVTDGILLPTMQPLWALETLTLSVPV